MNPEPDYSAAYVVLRTDDADLAGSRCSSRPGEATTSPAPLCGRWRPTSSDGTLPSSSGTSLRWPAAHMGRPAALAGPREGRDAHGHRRGRQRRMGPARRLDGQPLWRVLASLSPQEIVARSTSPTSTTRSTPSDALPPRGISRGRAGAWPHSKPKVCPPTPPRPAGWATTTPRWRASYAGRSPRVHHAGAEGRRRHLRHPAPAGRARRRRRGGAHRRSTPPALGRRPGHAGWPPRRVRAVLDRGTTSPDDVLGHRAIRRAVRPIRVATGEHVQNRFVFKQLLQAEAIDVVQIDACRVGGVNDGRSGSIPVWQLCPAVPDTPTHGVK